MNPTYLNIHNDAINMDTTLLCFVLLRCVVDSNCVFIHFLQGCIIGTVPISCFPQCLWNDPEWYGWNQPIPNHSKTLVSVNHVFISWHAVDIFCQSKPAYKTNFSYCHTFWWICGDLKIYITEKRVPTHLLVVWFMHKHLIHGSILRQPFHL